MAWNPMRQAFDPDPWDQIVGIPLDRWQAAQTSPELRDLIAERDAGTLYPEPESLAEHREANPDHDTFDVMTYGSVEPVRTICRCGATFRP